jgi:hypothetical protein
MTTSDLASAPQGSGRSQGGDGKAAAAAAAAGSLSEKPLGRAGLVDRRQYIRLLEQALSSLGFAEVADQLERASGVASQPPQVRWQHRACPT